LFTKKWERSFWRCLHVFGCCYILRPVSSRASIMMIAMTSSTHMMVPRLKMKKPKSHNKISITATRKENQVRPISKTLLTLNLATSILSCVTVNKQQLLIIFSL